MQPRGHKKQSRSFNKKAMVLIKVPGRNGAQRRNGAVFPPPRQRPAARRCASRIWAPTWKVLGPCFAPAPTTRRPGRSKQIDTPKQEEACGVTGPLEEPKSQGPPPPGALTAPLWQVRAGRP
jgi:hypothetical protein